MKHAIIAFAIMMMGWLLIPTRACAQAPATQAGAFPAALTVAVLDFAADIPGNADLGKQIGETLTATMASESGFTLVDRAMLDQTLKEHALNLTGLVNPDDAIKIGHLVGAKILITGKAFALDKSIFVTAKIIGTETSLVSGVVVKGKLDSDMGDLLTQLSDKIVARLHEAGASLVLQPDSTPDPMIALKAKLATLKLPRIGIIATDQHIGLPLLVAIDPPVDNTLRTMLTQAGFNVVDKDATSLTKAGAEWAVKAEGFSEFGARIGNLVTCTARVELSVVDLSEEKTVFSDSITSRATDISENIAGKTALENATHELGLRILGHCADTLPPAGGPAPNATQPGATATQATGRS
jgi:hypothetical protein